MNNTWFISDTHFYHNNIIKYCNRPFTTVEEMNETIIYKWNTVVKSNDIVWHLGDFCFGPKEYIPEIVKRLNGRIKLVKGNHDARTNNFYRESGFIEVYDYPVVVDTFMVLSHEPMPFVPSTMLNLYGHIHDSPMYETWGNMCACMCVERHNYTPVSLEEIKQHYVKE